jgi:hypothetical protein
LLGLKHAQPDALHGLLKPVGPIFRCHLSLPAAPSPTPAKFPTVLRHK